MPPSSITKPDRAWSKVAQSTFNSFGLPIARALAISPRIHDLIGRVIQRRRCNPGVQMPHITHYRHYAATALDRWPGDFSNSGNPGVNSPIQTGCPAFEHCGSTATRCDLATPRSLQAWGLGCDAYDGSVASGFGLRHSGGTEWARLAAMSLSFFDAAKSAT
jgi:hypothetical protein